ncbi:hypothetical protein V8C42DRAFT_323016, partial [Trichoderma barbatum]
MPVPLAAGVSLMLPPYHGKTRDRLYRYSIVALGYCNLVLTSESVGVQAVGALGQARLKGDDLRGLDRLELSLSRAEAVALVDLEALFFFFFFLCGVCSYVCSAQDVDAHL